MYIWICVASELVTITVSDHAKLARSCGAMLLMMQMCISVSSGVPSRVLCQL